MKHNLAFFILFAAFLSRTHGQWTILNTPSTGDFGDIAIMDSDHVAIASRVAIYGETVTSTDGGDTWMNQFIGFNPYDHAAFAGDSTYYLGGPGGAVYSTNAGITWNAVYNQWAERTGAFFLDPNHGFSSHKVGSGGVWGGLTYTDNACIIWDTIPDTLNSNSNAYYDLWFFDTLNGVAIGTDYIWFPVNGMANRTTDGGHTWSRTYFNYNAIPEDISFADTSLGFICGGNHIAKTFDGGFTWTQSDIDTTRFYTAITFADSLTGFVAGYEITGGSEVPFISKTTDAGATWMDELIPAIPGTSLIRAIKCATPFSCYCVGDSGLVMKFTGVDPSDRPLAVNPKGSVKIFPNPASDRVNLRATFESPVSGFIEVNLISMDGEVVWSKPINGGGMELEMQFIVGELPAGIYAISVSGQGFVQTARLIVQ